MNERKHLRIAAVARMTGVKQSTIRGYAAREQMPEETECPCCGSKGWDRKVIETWLAGRAGRTTGEAWTT